MRQMTEDDNRNLKENHIDDHVIDAHKTQATG